MRFDTIQFTTKLFIAIVFICIASVVIVATNAIRMSGEGLRQFGKAALANTHQAVFDTITMYDKSVRWNLEGDLRTFKREIETKGDVELISSSMLKQTMINEDTQIVTTQEIPRLVIGATYINGSHDFVDSIEKTTGATATIFQLVDDKLLRVSTTIKDQDGKRVMDTYIPPENPIYKTIMGGETFKAKALIADSWYLTAYTPLYDWDDKIVGAIYVGRPLLNKQIKAYISDVKIGNGAFYLYEKSGRVLLHPAMDPTTNLFDVIPEFRNQQDGSLTYIADGVKRFAHTALFEQWDVYLATDLDEIDINGGLDEKMVRTNLLVGFFVVTGGVVLTIFLIRSINRPLRDLAEKSVQVGKGDYTVEFKAANKDAIGQLTNALGAMVGSSRAMIKDIVQSSKMLSKASEQLLDIAEQMVAGADSTTRIADETSESALATSNNMDSISAAMEESATNLEIIATATSEMGSTIKEIAENSSKASFTTESAVTSAEKSHAGIHELSEAAKSIGTFTETISEISEQTNLLALNATIEAARAGEAGKGFAVVANEIKELARATAAATDQIKKAIAGIQSQTRETIVDIEGISTVIDDVNDIVSAIVTAVEEQAVTTNEIATNVNHASMGINDINTNVATSSQLTSAMSERVGQVKERSLTVKDNSEEIRVSAVSLSEVSEKLTALVSRFHID